MSELFTFEFIPGRRETTGEEYPLTIWKTYERVPGWDIFKINGESVGREAFEAKVKELQELHAAKVRADG